MTRQCLIADDAVAIIGIGCWYPDAPTPSRLWENVLARRRAFRRMPKERLPLDWYHDPDSRTPDKTYGRNASLIDGFRFDWIGRRIPKQTFESTDIAHWLALEVALQALDDAGYGKDTLPRERTGVIVGNTLTGEQSRSRNLRVRWPFVERAIRAAAQSEGLNAVATNGLVSSTESCFKSVFPPVDEDTLAGSLSNTIAGRICNLLDLHGGGYTVDGACASSLLAVTNAANSLCNRDLDVALVGGVDISLDPFELVGFAKVGALSRTQMRVYDRAANGFVPGEGCGFVVLKRLADARADGDYVYATVRGWGVSSDGAGGITAPSVKGQSLAIRRAYKRAGYSPGRLDFVEGHGTGTPAGDPVELKAIARAMKAYRAEQPRRCGVTSFKSIVGHTKAAAGIGGFIKAAIAANRRVIPPTSGCRDPSLTFEEDARVLYPLREGRVESPDAVVRAGVSAMGFGGINTHVTLESADPPASRLKPSVDERVLLASAQESELFVMSAPTVEALSSRVAEVAARADGLSMAELTDLSAELAQELEPGQAARAALVARDPDELTARVEEVLDALRTEPPAPGTVRAYDKASAQAWLSNAPPRTRVGFLFPGQGSQQLGMTRRLVERFDWAKRFVDDVDRWLVEQGQSPITPMMFRPLDRAIDGEQLRVWKRELRQTEHAQPAICLASVLWLKYLARLGVTPGVVGGHSLGELTAFFAAGAYDERTLIELAATRGRLMSQAKADGAMANLSCTREEAEGLIAEASGYCAVANLNAPKQTVVSGDREAVERIVRIAKDRSIGAVQLDVSGAFHSAHFEDAARALRDADGVPDLAEPLHTPMLSAMDGTAVCGGVSIRDYLTRQMCAEVNFVSLVRAMAECCDLVVEVGSGRALSGLVKRTVDGGPLRCFPVEARAGQDEDFNVALAALFAHGHRLRLDALFESRLCRPFVPASERVFIANPCERPFADEEAPAEAPPVSAGREQVPASAPPQAADPVIPAARTERTVRDAVLQAVEGRTGFPVDSLTLDLRLVDDLHLDSIKTVELASDVADQVGILEAFDAAQFADATLGELVERMELLATESAGAECDSENTPETTAAPAASAPPNGPAWIGSFAVEWAEAPPAESTGNAPEGAVLLLAANPGDPTVHALLQELRLHATEVRVCTPDALQQHSAPFDHVVAVVTESPLRSDMEALREAVEALTASARALAEANAVRGRPSCVAWIRVRGSAASAEGHFDWAADAFAASVHLERRAFVVRSLDFTGAEPMQLARAVVRELRDDEPYRAARYDAGGQRFVGRPTLQDRAAYRPRKARVGPNDVVLVTGGAKGITAECALQLARESTATMVLVGSSPMPDARAEGAGANEIQKTLARFQAEGLRCEYRQCNVAVKQDVERLIAKVQREVGAIDVVVHGAGLNHPRRADEPDAAQALAEVAPKLVGALHLFDALDEAPPKLFVALTSVIGVIGMPHNAWYAFANQSLDRSLGRFAARHPSVEALSLAYSIWDEVGMGAKLGSIERLRKLGIQAIPVDEGVARFVELVTRDPSTREVIITGRLGGVDTWRPAMPSLPRAHRFIEDVISFEPGSELVCRASLDLERDPYLCDHVYEGSLLVPTVFGLEAMAEAAAYVTGRAELPFPLTIEDVELARPLVVHPQRGLVIEVRARVEREDEADEHIHTEIRCGQSGFEQAHFSASFVIDGSAKPGATTQEIPTRALPIDPKRDLYGKVLFQGPRFQRIDEVYSLDETRCTFAATQGLTEESWLLGDPYFRDALLQSLQLCVVPDQCLPVRIASWSIVRPTASGPSNRLSRATIQSKDGDTYVGTVSSVAAEGKPVETLRGYRARTLARRPDWPSAGELARSGSARVTELEPLWAKRGARTAVNVPQRWDGDVFYRDVPGYGHEGQTAFFWRFPLSAQDSSSVSGSLNSASYFRWAGKLREWGGINTPGVYKGILEMLGSNEVMSATNECETRIFKVPKRNDLIEGRYWMEYVNEGDAGNIFEWWRIPFPSGEPELIAWTRMRISAVKAIRHGVISSTSWPDFLYRFLKDMGDDAPEPTRGPALDIDLGEPLFKKPRGPQPGVVLAEEAFATSQDDSNVVGNIYFANYSAWQSRTTDRYFHSVAPELFQNRGALGELHRVETKISQLRDAMPFDEIEVVMRLEELYARGARLSFDFFRKEADGVTKIAAGQSLVSWATIDRGAAPEILDWPDELREAMVASVHERRRVLKKYA